MPQGWTAGPAPDTSAWTPGAAPDFVAHAQIPTVEQLAAAQTPAERVQLLSQTPVGQDLGAIKDLVKSWADNGPHAVVEGIKNFVAGNYAKGAHQVITGAGLTALPMVAAPLAAAAVAAPIATGLTAAGAIGAGYAGQKMGEAGARQLGATPDQAALAGDVGALAGGTLGAKLGEGLNSARLSWAAMRRTAQGAQSTLQLKQAMPPTKSAPYTDDQFQRAMPYLDLEHRAEPVTSVQGFRDAADSAVKGIEDHIDTLIKANPTDTITTNPLAEVRAKLSQSVRGDALDAGLKELDDLKLDQPVTVVDAERIRKQLNAENTAILRKNSYDVATARAADPGFAAREIAAQSLRTGIYDALDLRGAQGVRALRQDEGSIIALRNAAERQIYAGGKNVAGTGTNVFARKAAALGVRSVPGMPAVMADPIAALIAPPSLTRDALVEKGFANRVPGAVPNVPTLPNPAMPSPHNQPVMPPRSPVTPPGPSIAAAPQPGRFLPPGERPPTTTTYTVNPPPAQLPAYQTPGLPAYREPIITPPPADTSGGGGVRALKAYPVRDPTTGRFKMVFLSDADYKATLADQAAKIATQAAKAAKRK